jgi:hypothetical protein
VLQHRRSDHLLENGELKGLGQVIERSALKQRPGDFGVAVAGDDDDGDIRRVTTERLQDGLAGQVGKSQIQQHHRGLVLRNDGERLLSSDSDAHLVTEVDEGVTQHGRDLHFVVDNQHPTERHHGAKRPPADDRLIGGLPTERVYVSAILEVNAPPSPATRDNNRVDHDNHRLCVPRETSASLASALLDLAGMIVAIRSVPGRIGRLHGSIYRARVCGRPRDDGTWEGWLEFDPIDLGATLQTPRETTQPNRADLEYWATGLTPVYLEGALDRARGGRDVVPVSAVRPHAPPGPVRGAVLDPFAVHLKGEELLRKQLAALSRDHLLAIVHVYGFEDDDHAMTLTTPALIALIVARTPARRAA